MLLRNPRQLVKWALFGVLGLAGCYAALFAVVLTAMRQPPARFGLFMKHMPGVLVWGTLPAQRMWLWARRGELAPSTPAPDFTLSRYGDSRSDRVTLSSYRGQRPVVLVFGSYT